MAANMTVVTNLLNGRRVGRFANRKTLSNDETIQEAIDGIEQPETQGVDHGKSLWTLVIGF